MGFFGLFESYFDAGKTFINIVDQVNFAHNTDDFNCLSYLSMLRT
jgi:hypothetical protein